MPRTINWDRVAKIRASRHYREAAQDLAADAKQTDDILKAAGMYARAAGEYLVAHHLLRDARADNLATKMGEAAAECQKASDALLARAAA